MTVGRLKIWNDAEGTWDYVGKGPKGDSAEIPYGRMKSASLTYLGWPGAVWIAMTTLNITADATYYEPMTIAQELTLDRLIINVITQGAGSTIARLGIYNADEDWQPTTLVLDAGTVAVDSTGVKEITISELLPVGRYLLALNSSGAPEVRSFKEATTAILDTMGSVLTSIRVGSAPGVAAGGLPDPGTVWSATSSSATLGFHHSVIPRVSAFS